MIYIRRLVPWLVTVVSVIAMVFVIGSVIDQRRWVPEVVLLAIAPLTAAELSRIVRNRSASRSKAMTLGVAMSTLVVLAHASYAGEAARWGWFPTWRSWTTLSATLNEGALAISSSVPPAAPQPALIALVAISMALIAVPLYWTIAVVSAPLVSGLLLFGSALVPMSVLDQGAPLTSFLMLGTMFLAILALHQQGTVNSWGRTLSVTEGDSPIRMNGMIGAGLAVMSISLIAPLIIPGLDEPVWRPGTNGTGGTGNGEGAASSLLLDSEVSLRRELTRDDDIEILRYRTTDDTPNYLRMGALTEFDGTVWTRRSFTRLNSDDATIALLGLSSEPPRSTYTISVGQLNNRLLPVPYPALTVSGIQGRWAIDALTLTVFSEDARAGGQRYTVTAFDVAPSSQELSAISDDDYISTPPLGTAREWLAYPADLDQEVVDLTASIVRGSESPYERALALQNWFRNGFSYSLEVRSDPTKTPLMSFLDDRSGYCEQFAGAMALMARITGIPARVAIGFTSGTQGPTGVWSVTAHDAHAWPELWFPDFGWVRFEPTPRADIASGVAVPAYAPAPSREGEQGERRGEQSGQGATTGQDVPGGAQDVADDPGAGVSDINGISNTEQWRWRVLAGLGIAALMALAIPAVIRRVRLRKRIRLMRKELDVGLDAAWDELRDVFVDTAAPWSSTMTPRQSVAALMTRISDEASQVALKEIMSATEQMRFANKIPQQINLEGNVQKVSYALRRPMRRTGKLRLWLFPASVIRRRGSDHGDVGNVPQP